MSMSVSTNKISASRQVVMMSQRKSCGIMCQPMKIKHNRWYVRINQWKSSKHDDVTVA